MSVLNAVLLPAIVAAIYYVMFGLARVGGLSLFVLSASVWLNRNYVLVGDGGFLNFLVWAGILIAIWSICEKLPRAIRCWDIIFALFMAVATAMVMWQILGGKYWPDVTASAIHRLLMVTVGGIGSVPVVLKLGRPKETPSAVLRGMDRALASVLMGMILSFAGSWSFGFEAGKLLYWLLAAVFAGGWFALDIFCFERIGKIAGDMEDRKKEKLAKKLEQSGKNVDIRILAEIESERLRAERKELDRKEKAKKQKEKERERERRERERELEWERRKRAQEDADQRNRFYGG